MAITSYKAVVGYYNSAGTPNITTAVTGQLSDGWIPIGAPILTDAYGQCTQMMAKTDATPVIATSAYTVVTAANPQPPDATWDAQGEPLWIDTATYLQAYTKGGAYLQGVVPVSRGGTGATNATDAWLNIRPTGPTPLAANPVNPLDAATKQWVEALRSVNGSWKVTNGYVSPSTGTIVYGGTLVSECTINSTPTYKAELVAYGTVGQDSDSSGMALSNSGSSWQFRDNGKLRLPDAPVQLTTFSESINISSDRSVTLINNVTATPPTNTVVYGRSVKSDFKIAGVSQYSCSLQPYGTIGQGTNASGVMLQNNTYMWQFRNNGALSLPNSPVQLTSDRPDGTLVSDVSFRPKDVMVQGRNSVGVLASENNAVRMTNYTPTTTGDFVNTISGDWFSGYWTLGGVRSGDTLLDRVQINVYDGSSSTGSFQFAANGVASCTEWRNTSDERIKSNVARISDPLAKMRNIKGVSWTMETNGSAGFGFIAQDVEKDFPGAVSEIKFSPVTLRDGTVLNDVKSVNTPGVAAALHHEAILALMDKVEALEAELSALKSGK